MNLLNITFIALALALDAFAISIASGVIIKKDKLVHALKFGIMFGSFQMIMPIIGWISGIKLQNYLKHIDHWIAFILLTLVGAKMIYEALKIESIEQKERKVTWFILFTLAIATSIDALAVGITFSFINITIFFPALIIGIVAFIFSFIGIFLGNKFGNIFENKIEMLGGIILIGIGLKILITHLM